MLRCTKLLDSEHVSVPVMMPLHRLLTASFHMNWVSLVLISEHFIEEIC